MQRLVATALFLATVPAQAAGIPVWISGTEGYNAYRIPALLVSAKGTLLAFAEGRLNGRGDSGAIHILLKRSWDQGATWSAASTVLSFGDDTAGNPAPVLDRRTGKIWLLATRNPGADTEAQILNHTSKGTRTVWVTHSDDDGRTWSDAVEITYSVKPAEWTWYATGPGAGIQLRSGRLMVACDHNSGQPDGWFSHVIYSDDAGATWKLGGSAGPQGNESTVVELADGRLILNMRSSAKLKNRLVAYSMDRGATWSEGVVDPVLIDPVCEGAILRAGKADIVFSNAASAKREALTIRLSRDGGKTWMASHVIQAGPAAYSSLAQLPDRSIGVLYEAGEKTPYETITFTRLPEKWWSAKPASSHRVPK
jgi:sialidase-1